MKYFFYALGIVLLAFLAWVFVPYFTVNEVQEEIAIDLSQFENVSETTQESPDATTTQEPIEEEPTEAATETPVDDSTETNNMDSEPIVIEEPQTQQETVVVEPVAPEPVVNQPHLFQGEFMDADPTHLASGNVYISGSNLSLVNFDSTNVPDGFVYLANDLDARDYVRVSKLKGNKGNQNYVLPDGVDAGDYKYVLIWCRAFSVLVGSAQIN